MNLYILRHARAEEHGAQFPDDSQRPLTSAGEEEMRRVAGGMHCLELKFDLILSSPFVRASRTAEIVAEVFGPDKLRFSANLASGGNAGELINELNRDYPDHKNILLVGHEPDLSRLVSLLTTGERELWLSFKKAGLCKLALEKLRAGQCANLEWLLTPAQLEEFRKR